MSTNGVMKPGENNRAGLLPRLMAEWRFISVVAFIAFGGAFAWVRWQDMLATQALVVAEVERQSMVDSVATFARYDMSIGLLHTICWNFSDTVTDVVVQRAERRGCGQLLRGVPWLKDGNLPAPPNARVWRSPAITRANPLTAPR